MAGGQQTLCLFNFISKDLVYMCFKSVEDKENEWWRRVSDDVSPRHAGGIKKFPEFPARIIVTRAVDL